MLCVTRTCTLSGYTKFGERAFELASYHEAFEEVEVVGAVGIHLRDDVHHLLLGEEHVAALQDLIQFLCVYRLQVNMVRSQNVTGDMFQWHDRI